MISVDTKLQLHFNKSLFLMEGHEGATLPSLRAGSLVRTGSLDRELARRMGFTHTFPRFAGSWNK